MSDVSESEAVESADTAAMPDCAGSPRRSGWSWTLINFWLDAWLLLNVVCLGWITATLRVVFPAPTVADDWTLWGWDYDHWADVQFSLLCLFAFGAVVHVMFHWNWVCNVIGTHFLTQRRRIDSGTQTLYGVGLLIVLLHIIGAGVILALLSVHRPPAG